MWNFLKAIENLILRMMMNVCGECEQISNIITFHLFIFGKHLLEKHFMECRHSVCYHYLSSFLRKNTYKHEIAEQIRHKWIKKHTHKSVIKLRNKNGWKKLWAKNYTQIKQADWMTPARYACENCDSLSLSLVRFILGVSVGVTFFLFCCWQNY